MTGNSFGHLFRITTAGESHGASITVIIEGMPPGIDFREDWIQEALQRRRPGQALTSGRQEADDFTVESGVFSARTTGTPIMIRVLNRDARSEDYEPLRHTIRPGHAHYTYLKKYGVFDHRGGGRASARETVVRVAAGAVARMLLHHHGIETVAFLSAVGPISATLTWPDELEVFKQTVYSHPIFSPWPNATEMIAHLEDAIASGDSCGGRVHYLAQGVPAGLGEPVFLKLEAMLAQAMMSIPATKAFAIGSGFTAAEYSGSTHNDALTSPDVFASNHAGGVLGGISTGMPLYGEVTFKPTSSIRQKQKTLTTTGQEVELTMNTKRHDPCVAIRGVPVVEAMLNLVLADALLMQQTKGMSCR